MYAKDKTTIHDRREMLRVKVKSLMEEARIIRKEERRIWGPLYNELRHHRVLELRREARATHIAYGLIRGVGIHEMERKADTKPDWENVARMVRKYGSAEVIAGFDVTAVLKAA